MRLIATPADRLSTTAAPGIAEALEPRMLRAVMLGIASAFASIDSVPPVLVTVAAVTDHSGSTSELGLNLCAEGVAYHLLGFPERAPRSGVTAGA